MWNTVYIGCFNIHGTHVTSNNSPNNNVLYFFVLDLKIVYYNNYLSSTTMPWTIEEKYFASLIIWGQNHSKQCKQHFAGSLTSTIIPEKPNLSLGRQISSHKVSKQLQLEGRKFQIWQVIDSKMSWQCGCVERFSQKEPEKVPLKTFPRNWSFMRIVVKNFKDLQLYPYRIQIKHIIGLHLYWDTSNIYMYIINDLSANSL